MTDFQWAVSNWLSRIAAVLLLVLFFRPPLETLGNNIGAMLDRKTVEHYEGPVIRNVQMHNNLFSGAEAAFLFRGPDVSMVREQPEWAKLKQEIHRYQP